MKHQCIVSLPLRKIPVCQKNTEKLKACVLLGELNNAWENRYDHTLTSIISPMVPQHNLIAKKTKAEAKRRDRDIKKIFEHHLGENATIALLAEGESLSSYTLQLS